MRGRFAIGTEPTGAAASEQRVCQFLPAADPATAESPEAIEKTLSISELSGHPDDFVRSIPSTAGAIARPPRGTS
jgi:hypothetical protein